MATLHLMIGLPCSGKTTYARQLAGETNALLLTLDVWHLKLFGDDVGQGHHDERHERIEKIMWDVAKHVLEMGGDVILDFQADAAVPIPAAPPPFRRCVQPNQDSDSPSSPVIEGIDTRMVIWSYSRDNLHTSVALPAVSIVAISL